MLPAEHRLRRHDEFAHVVRHGRRAHSDRLLVHACVSPADAEMTKIGFVVGKQVGNAVRRNRVRRQLRAVAADVLPSVTDGAQIVIRAMPKSDKTGFHGLATALTSALSKVGALPNGPTGTGAPT